MTTDQHDPVRHYRAIGFARGDLDETSTKTT